MVKLQIPAGAATPAPPVGPALGQAGVNIMDFLQELQRPHPGAAGHDHPGRGHRLFRPQHTFITKTPPAAVLLRKRRGWRRVGRAEQEEGRPGDGGAGRGDRQDQAADLNAASLEAAVRIIEGTARSMGLEIA